MNRPLVIAILAKNKAHILPTYLNSLLAQTAVDSNTIFYIRTNDNKDNTSEILRSWYEKWNWKFRMVFDDSSINPELLNFENHEWNGLRFKILGGIRQKSIEFAIQHNADYFIADADNILEPTTIEKLRKTGLPVVAPLLRSVDNSSMYSNFHSSIDSNGYFIDDEIYTKILYRVIRGLIEVPVVHCTYFVRNEALPAITYDDDTYRFEYVIFSDSLRKAGISQYIDSRILYGRASFSVNAEEWQKDLQNPEVSALVEYINKSIPTEWQTK